MGVPIITDGPQRKIMFSEASVILSTGWAGGGGESAYGGLPTSADRGTSV